MSATPLTVDGYSTRWLSQGFPWVYPKEVVKGSARPRDEVLLRDQGGRVLGRGIADRGFLAARVMRHDDGPLDDAWLARTLERARALRREVVDPDTTGYRLVNGENDGLPGIRVDRWGPWAVVILDSPSLGALVPRVVAWLRASDDPPSGAALCYRRDPRDEEWTRLDPPPGLLYGTAPEGAVEITERGLRYGVVPLDGPDVGLYADMRRVRAWLEPSWRGKRLLNLFAYTGAFTVSAAAHGAIASASVDLSAGSLERARDNLSRNGLRSDEHEMVVDDVFKVLDRYRRKGVTFDRIVVDPPSFSRGAAVFSAKRDWPRLAAAAVRVLDDGGWFVACSNQGELSPKAFDGLLTDGLRKAGATAQLLLAASQGPDFPAATAFPEGRYLKVRVLRVLR